MAVYTIADLHLSEDVPKPMDVFGGVWKGYREKILDGFRSLSLAEDDMIIIGGDFSWGIRLEETVSDFKLLDGFPGKKILLKGNHDLWWETVSKMNRFFEKYQIKTFDFLHNNAFFSAKTAFCGTRGWFFEEERSEAHDKKMLNRELMRLEASLKQAKKEAAQKIYVFLHYPPVYAGYRCREMVDLMVRYGVSRCYYGHLHGPAHNLAYQGTQNGIEYRLVAADYIGFKPVLVDKV